MATTDLAPPATMAGMNTTFVSERTFTQDEFLAWIETITWEDPWRYELVKGRIVMSPPAGWPHGRHGANVVVLLGNHAARHGGQVLDSSMGYVLPTGDVLEPDASWISRERWAAGPEPQRGKLLRIVPDLVCEVLSPYNRDRDLGEKRAIYAASGIREYWIVDPDAPMVMIIRGTEGPEFYGPRKTFRSDVLGRDVEVDVILGREP